MASEGSGVTTSTCWRPRTGKRRALLRTSVTAERAISRATPFSRPSCESRRASGGGGSNTPRFTFSVSMRRTASSRRAWGSSPRCTASSSASYTSVFFSSRQGISTMSAPAFTAITAARPTP